MSSLLVPVDFSEGTNAILTEAQALASKIGTELILLHVAPPDPDFIGYDPGPEVVRQQVAETFRDEHQQLQRLEREIQKNGGRASALLVQGPTVEKILQERRRLDCSLIVIGSHGHSAVYDLLVGSITEGVLRHADCPVLVVPCSAPDSARTA